MSKRDSVELRNQLVIMQALLLLVSTQRKQAGDLKEQITATKRLLGDPEKPSGEAWGPGSGNW